MQTITDGKWPTRFMLGTYPSLFYLAYGTYYRLNSSQLSDSGEFTDEKRRIVPQLPIFKPYQLLIATAFDLYLILEPQNHPNLVPQV
ncbi:MAG: hypothetical protein EWV54_15155 [Microcystis novacekii Mn_MB_F_20050700_S1D]|uniref:Uncharacterized protein n=1 Tax=Microcystis novacekii Mn_MB_F_20050700_S1D TaxID=2486266 RepID=A0A552IRC7_9CHRO|nr:MAG: hypothetical protein EWV54_15155 [Microcystis novacekii Mn_MB_F_20050700_S1D]